MVFAHIFAWLALLIATVVDIKKREVPDTISYGLIGVATILGIATAFQNSSWEPFISMCLGFLLGLVVGAGMFFLGQWGGGDSKLIVGLGGLFGFGSFFGNFLLLTVVAGAIYGLAYGLFLAYKYRKEFSKAFKKRAYTKPMRITRGVFQVMVFTALILAMFVFTETYLRLTLVLGAAGIYFLFYSWLFAKVLEESCMKKKIRITDLVEGDWVLEPIVVGKKKIIPAKFGITKEQIALAQKSKQKTILVKEGIPFVPSFLLAYAMTLYAEYVGMTFF